MSEEESSQDPFSFLLFLADNKDRFLVRSGFQFKTGFRRAHRAKLPSTKDVSRFDAICRR